MSSITQLVDADLDMISGGDQSNSVGDVSGGTNTINQTNNDSHDDNSTTTNYGRHHHHRHGR